LPVITVGVDLAAMPERTALAGIEWTTDRAVIRDVICPAGDDVIVQNVERAGKTGIDCPLGWPGAFVDFVAAHRAGNVGIPEDTAGVAWRRELATRRTDAFVRRTVHVVPLSVSADRIAHVAFRCAVLLAKLNAAGYPVDRAGSGPVVEVYPAASLRCWGLDHRGYKQPSSPERLCRLVDNLRAAVPWLEFGSHEEAIRHSHDRFDAVIAAMTARAVLQGHTYRPGEADLDAARTEGWIAVPNAAISRLVGTHF
jgi:predicted nuclease with RNAse H fold